MTVTARQDVDPGGNATIRHTVAGGDYESVTAESVFAIVIGRLASNFVTNIQLLRYSLVDYDLAQGFTTGSNETGYKLKNVQLFLFRQTATDDLPTVKIFSGSATGTEEVTLTTPITTQTGDRVEITFPAPENSMLDMSTHYWVVAEADSGDIRWYDTITNHNTQLAMGWSLDDQGQFRDATSTGSFSILNANANRHFQIAIDGAPLPPLPEITIAADTSLVTEGTAAAFTLTRTGRDMAALTVDVSVSESEDMIEATNEGATTVTFQAGSATATLSVISEDDEVDEDNSVVTATLVADTASPAKYKVGTVSSATVTVEDNDTADMMTEPRVTSIARQTPASSPTNANSLTWRVTFSEDVENVDTMDFEVNGTTATPTAVSEITASTVYDVTVSGGNLADRNATVTLAFAAGQDIQDEAGNALSNTTPTGANDNDYVVDNAKPTVTITGVPMTSTAAFTATITFLEPVNGFAVGDITVGNGTAPASFIVVVKAIVESRHSRSSSPRTLRCRRHGRCRSPPSDVVFESAMRRATATLAAAHASVTVVRSARLPPLTVTS